MRKESVAAFAAGIMSKYCTHNCDDIPCSSTDSPRDGAVTDAGRNS